MMQSQCYFLRLVFQSLYLQQGTIYSDMQILFGMIYVTMSSINSMSDKLANKKDVVEQYLGPLKKEIDEWKQREDKAKSTGAYG
jgi:hypothetical protein